MLKVALCDDNSKTLQHYAKWIVSIAKKHNMDIELSCFTSGESLLFRYAEAPEQVDILYLDIVMSGTDGMKTAQKLRDGNCNAQIIFLTGFADYVYDAFDVNAVQYLLKDNTDHNKFEGVFLKAAALASRQEEELFTFTFDGKITTVPVDQIAYFEIWKRLVSVHYGNGQTEKFYGSMKQLEDQFAGKGFARTHRSYLVNLSYVAVFQQQTLRLKTGGTIPVGVTHMQSLKQAFSNYILRFRRHSLYVKENGTCSAPL